MRIHPWLAAFSSVCLLIAAGESSAHAQQVSDAVFESGGFETALDGSVTLTAFAEELSPLAETSPPKIRSQSPGGVVFSNGHESQNPATIWPQQTPLTYQPYPEISPYYPPNISRQTTYNRNGLWFKELLHRDREYYLTMEYLLARYRNPGNDVVGARPVPFFRHGPTTGGTGGGGGGGGAGAVLSGGVTGELIDNLGLGGPALIGIVNPSNTLNRFNIGPGVWPFPIVNQTPTPTDQSLADETLFPIRTLGHFDNHLKSDGMRVRWGFEDEDGSGLMLSGWFATESRDKFQAGRDAYNGILINQAILLANSPTGGQSPVFPRNGSLPLTFREDIFAAAGGAAGVLDIVGYTGVPQKYDVLFQYDISTFASGGALHLYHEPIFERNWVAVRPAFGARYQYLEERFGFRGIDSGFGYTLDFGSTGAGGGGQGQQQVPLFRPDTTDVNVPLDQNGVGFFLDSRLNSQIDSHMGGAEVGLRYDFGSGDSFSIWGQSMVGLLANHQRIQLEGDDIGDPRIYWLATGGQTGGINFTDESIDIDTDFFEEDQHTVASPMFEQSVFIDMAVFKYIPLLNKMHVLESAKFRTGYTYTVIGGIYRPGESINWRAFPDFPTIASDKRKTWHTHNWSFAVHWEF